MADLALRSRGVLEQGSHGWAEPIRLHSHTRRAMRSTRSHTPAYHAALLRTRCSSAPGGDHSDVSKRRRSALRVSRAIGSVMPVAMSSDVGIGIGIGIGDAARPPSAAPIQTSVAEAIASGELGEDDWERALAESKTSFVAETLLPTRSGKFRVRAYRHQFATSLTEPSAIIKGNVEGRENVPVRVHDACFTSEVLGSMKCDCAEQLNLALEYMHENDGMVIYLQQEGRGIGLANKIAAYAMQEKGFDTVDANRELGLPDDCREYTSVKNILDDLGIKSIQLMTNNPRKVNTMSCLGINITNRIPCVVKSNDVNQGYLEAKQDRMNHDLDADSDSDLLDGSWCYWDHSGDL